MEILKRGMGFRKTVVLLLTLVAIIAPVAGQSIDEYEVKAAYLFNFAKFVDWPPGSETQPFALCILGDDPFGPIIDRTVKGKTTGGRPMEVRRLKDPLDSKKCQIVFVRSGENEKASKLIDAVRRLPVLTVGESPEFARMGGIINILTRGDRVGFAINSAAAAAAGVKISAKLYTLAKAFEDETGKGK